MKVIIKSMALLLLNIPVIAFYFVLGVIKLVILPLGSIVALFIIGYMACKKGEGWIDEMSAAIAEYKKEKKNIQRNFMVKLKMLLGMKANHYVTMRIEWEEEK